MNIERNLFLWFSEDLATNTKWVFIQVKDVNLTYHKCQGLCLGTIYLHYFIYPLNNLMEVIAMILTGILQIINLGYRNGNNSPKMKRT